MKVKLGRLIKSILFALTSIIYFFLAYIGYEKQNLNLCDYTQYENIVTNKGITTHYKDERSKANVFFISLMGMKEQLGIYRMTGNYEDLSEKIIIGDKIKVYYRPSTNKREKVNIDLIQIEKDGEIIIAKDEYENKESSLIYIGLIAGFLTLFLSYRYYTWR